MPFFLRKNGEKEGIRMKLKNPMLVVTDIDKSVEFYKKIGFEVAHETKDGDVRVVFLKLRDLILETYDKEAALCYGAVDHIAFDVVDIEEAYKFITGLQIKILTEITLLPFWEKGVKFFIAQGPNLERLEFAQHIK